MYLLVYRGYKAPLCRLLLTPASGGFRAGFFFFYPFICFNFIHTETEAQGI